MNSGGIRLNSCIFLFSVFINDKHGAGAQRGKYKNTFYGSVLSTLEVLSIFLWLSYFVVKEEKQGY